MPSPHLRVGLIQGKRIVEERVLRGGKDVTFGASPRDTFILPPDVLARTWRLFEERGGRLVLRLAPAMSARVANGADLASFGPANDTRAVELAPSARGKITVGDTTILFQRVRAPVAQPRPQLPASVRRHVLAELDGVFTAFVTASLLLHLAMVVYLRHVDWPRRPAIDEIPDRFITQFVKTRPKPPPTPATPKATTAAAERPPTPTRPAPARPAAPTKAAPTAEERHAALQKEVQKVGFIAYLTARGEGDSPIKDVLADGNADREVEEALKGATGVAVADSGQLRNLAHPGAGTGRVATPIGLRQGGDIARADTGGPATERAARGQMRLEDPIEQDGHVDAAAIAREIRARRKAVSACYERALKAQPTLAGKLVVRFSLSAAGTVTAVDVDEDLLGSPDVTSCIRAVALRWRFPALAEGPAALSFPFVFQPGG
jgi:hypothetical protein